MKLKNKNSSRKYATGTEWVSNQGRTYKIAGQLDDPTISKKGHCHYRSFLVEFNDGYQRICTLSQLSNRSVLHPCHPTVRNRGYLGIGSWEAWDSDNKCNTPEYQLWNSMFTRCYSEKYHRDWPTYKDCEVDERWWNFQIFCEDIKQLPGYSKWKTGEKYVLDKDMYSHENKIYSLERCIFIDQHTNICEMIERTRDPHNPTQLK